MKKRTSKPAPAAPQKKRTHPWRAWVGNSKTDRDPETIVPHSGRLVRR